LRWRTTTIMRINCHRTGHNRCSRLCVHVTNSTNPFPGTAPARSNSLRPLTNYDAMSGVLDLLGVLSESSSPARGFGAREAALAPAHLDSSADRHIPNPLQPPLTHPSGQHPTLRTAALALQRLDHRPADTQRAVVRLDNAVSGQVEIRSSSSHTRFDNRLPLKLIRRTRRDVKNARPGKIGHGVLSSQSRASLQLEYLLFVTITHRTVRCMIH
jgi:hypothetical protein